MERSPNGLRSRAKRLTSGMVFGGLAAVGFVGACDALGSCPRRRWGREHRAAATQHDSLSPCGLVGAAGGRKAADLSQGGEIRLTSADVAEQMGIRLATAESRSLARELSVTARVLYEPTRIAQISSRAPGTVWRVEKHVGQWIHHGEVLAVVECVAVGKAKADLLHALADVALKERIVTRLKALDTGLIPHKQVDSADVDLRKARFDLFNVEQELVNLGLPVDREKLAGASDEELLRYVKFLGLPESIVESLDSQTATANLLPLLAPFDGLVVGQDIVRGERIAIDENRFEIADVTHMLLRLDVREEDGEDLRLGQQVVVRDRQRASHHHDLLDQHGGRSQNPHDRSPL